MSKPPDQQCGNCKLYEEVPEENRIGRQWNFNTGYCLYKPPSSKRAYKPQTAFDNWCENWKSNMDVSKAIIEEGNRRYDEKKKKNVSDDEFVQNFVQKMDAIDEAAEPAEKKELFVDRSYRPYVSPNEGKQDDEWVPNEQLHHMTNVHGRRWKTKDGSMSGTFTYVGSIPPEAHERGILWYFPAEPETPEELDPLTLAWQHVRKRVADVEETEGPYGEHVLCSKTALLILLAALDDKVELPADD